jgi:hypothetical protein
MNTLSKFIVTLACVGLVGSIGMFAPVEAQADSKHKHKYEHGYKHGNKHWKHKHTKPRVIHHGRTVVIPDRRVRRYHDTYVYRPHGHWYRGYGGYYVDDDAYPWLAFTAITLKVLDNINEDQQRKHEQAQIAATSAPIGETIVWSDGSASGSVTATREGTTTSGRYCREFQHEVTVGGRRERAYGVACRQPDGSWEIVSTANP